MIYAFELESRYPKINTDINLNNYDKETDIIAPGLFGFGYAFPIANVDKAVRNIGYYIK